MPLTNEQKERWRKGFKEADKDNDGKITSKELKEALSEILDDFSEADIKELIAEVDSNKDGIVNFEEFCILMEKIVDELAS